MTLLEVSSKATTFAAAHADLAAEVTTLDAQIAALKAAALPNIKALLKREVATKDTLINAIGESEHLFQKPRTLVISGIRCGFAKSPGKITITDSDKTVDLIQKHLSDQFDILVHTTYAPVKKALAQLPAKDLKSIGVTITDTTDRVIADPVDSDITKLLASILEA